jgi:GDP-L-fucose synthase
MILVTGGRGFLGRWLLASLGPRPHLAPSRSELDLLDGAAVLRFCTENRIDKIIHAAGFVGGIGLHREHPGRVAVENTLMGANLLQAAASLRRPPHVVIVSTVCAYPERAPVPTPESCLYDGYPAPDTAAYGLAKRTLHSMAQALQSEYGLSWTYAIPTNLYGPNDHFDPAKSHVVPALVRRVREARLAGAGELSVWGDGSATRDLLYVNDCARLLVQMLDDPAARGETFNVSSGRETTIFELATTICELSGFDGRLNWDVTKPQGAARRALDPSKARRLLGFVPSTSLADGLRQTIDWYQTTKTEPS